jgi:type I restriction enzyme, S subunit
MRVPADLDSLCSFVPMNAVDESTAEIQQSFVRKYKDVFKGYTQFVENDVLLAKITPCMENGKCAIARRLYNGVGFGSSEFHIIRASSKILPEWIYYFWRLPETRAFAERNMTGTAGQRRVPTSFIESLRIPVPSIADQQKRIELLVKADGLRRMRRHTLQMCDQLLPAAFLEMFGDPLPAKTKSPTNPLTVLGTLDRGRSRHRPRNAPHLYGGPYPFIQTGDVAQAHRRILTHQQTYSEDGLRQSKLWPAGTLCITIAANIADTAVLTYPACFPDSVVGFTPANQVTVEYIQFWLQYLQRSIKQAAPEVAQKNIRLT